MLSKAVETVFVLIYLPFLTRYLGKDNYGNYTFAYSFVGMFEIVAWLGIHRIVVRETARSHDKARLYYTNALSIKLVLSLVAAVCLVVAVVMHRSLDSLARQVILIAGAEMLIRAYGTVNESLFRAFERMQNELLLTTIDLGTATLGVFAAIILDLGLLGVMVAFLSGAMAYTITGFFLSSRAIGELALGTDIPACKLLIKEGIPIGGSTGMQRVYQRQGTVYLRSSQDVGQVGIYGGGLRIYNLTAILSAAIVNSAFPMLSRRALGDQRALMTTIETNLKVLMSIAGVIAVSLFLVAETIIPLLVGKELAEITLVVQLLSPAIVFAFGSTLFSIVLESVNRQQLNTIAWAIVLVLNLGFNIVLAPRIGYVGSTLAFLATEIVFALLTFSFVWKKVGRFATYSPVVKPLVTTLVCWVLGWLLWQKLGLVTLLIIMPLYVLMIWKLNVFTKEEIDSLKHTFLQQSLSGAR
jgi:O-antigen/teichoic acid export membrane protein